MTRRLIGLAAFLALCSVVGGCKSSSRTFVEENSQGFIEVRGQVEEVHGLSFRKSQDLSDGFMMQVGKQGCSVKIAQSEMKTQTFELIPGDMIVFGDDFDFLLSKMKPGTTGPADTGGDKGGDTGGDKGGDKGADAAGADDGGGGDAGGDDPGGE